MRQYHYLAALKLSLILTCPTLPTPFLVESTLIFWYSRYYTNFVSQ